MKRFIRIISQLSLLLVLTIQLNVGIASEIRIRVGVEIVQQKAREKGMNVKAPCATWIANEAIAYTAQAGASGASDQVVEEIKIWYIENALEKLRKQYPGNIEYGETDFAKIRDAMSNYVPIVELTFTSTPDSATVTVDRNQKIGVAKFQKTYESKKKVKFKFEKNGYDPREEEYYIRPDKPQQTVSTNLQKKK